MGGALLILHFCVALNAILPRSLLTVCARYDRYEWVSFVGPRTARGGWTVKMATEVMEKTEGWRNHYDTWPHQTRHVSSSFTRYLHSAAKFLYFKKSSAPVCHFHFNLVYSEHLTKWTKNLIGYFEIVYFLTHFYFFVDHSRTILNLIFKRVIMIPPALCLFHDFCPKRGAINGKK